MPNYLAGAAAAALAIGLLATPATAKDLTDLTGTQPTEEQIRAALTPDEGREIRLRGLSVEPIAKAPPAEPKAVALSIEFDFNSAELTAASKRTLVAVAGALKSFPETVFVLTGHTDAVGSDAYNQRLSEQRADAVRSHLVRAHDLAPDRLISVGRGEAELLVPAQPDSGRNRRVEIINNGQSREVAAITPTSNVAASLRQAATGAAFFISQQGELLTSHSLVAACTEIRVLTGSTVQTAEHRGSDQANDLAVLTVPTGGSAVAAFRGGRGVRRADSVMVIGVSGSSAGGVDPANGTVSALTGPAQELALLQIAAAAGPGYIGGPVLDASGNVVGLNVGAHGENLNVAAKASTIRTFLDSLDVDYRTEPPDTPPLGNIVARSKGFTVPVECWR